MPSLCCPGATTTGGSLKRPTRAKKALDSGAFVIRCLSRCPQYQRWQCVLWPLCLLLPCQPRSLLGGEGSTCLPHCCGWGTRSISCSQRTLGMRYLLCCHYPWGACFFMPTCLLLSSLESPLFSSDPSFSWLLVSCPLLWTCWSCWQHLGIPSLMN